MEGGAAATRMGSRSSTRHGGPAQVFAGPVRKWRKLWSHVASTSPSPSAARVLLYKWMPITPSTGGAKDEAVPAEEAVATSTPAVRPINYIPVAVLLQKKKEEEARKEAEEAETQARLEQENQLNSDMTQDEPCEDKAADSLNPADT